MASTAERRDPYMLGRDYVASARLALIQLLVHAQFGYLLHPAITESLSLGQKTENLRIADVGTGTGIWLGELSRELPPSTKLDGFDISDSQYPPQEWYGPNVTLTKLDIFQPLPEELVAKYDIVHLRFFMTIASDRNVGIVLQNLKQMLKPGGYLQWVERDWMSKFPKTAEDTDDPHTQLAAHMRKYITDVESVAPPMMNLLVFIHLFKSNRHQAAHAVADLPFGSSWINSLPAHFTATGLQVLAYEHEPPLPIYRKPWNEDNLIGTEAFGDNIADDSERARFKNIHAQCALEAARGWYVDLEIIICAGKKG